MMVYVLIESGNTTPVAVLKKPERPYCLPGDAVEKMAVKGNQKTHVHKETVGQWTSEILGSIFSLVAFVVQ